MRRFLHIALAFLFLISTSAPGAWVADQDNRLKRGVPKVKGAADIVCHDNVSGAVLALDANAITGLSDGNTVATWSDQSGNGNDATQSTESSESVRTKRMN